MDSNLVAGLVGAVAAIGGVVVGGLVPWKVQQRAEEESKVRDYRETILRLLDVRELRLQELDRQEDPNKVYREELLGARVRMLRSIAESLAMQIPRRLSAHDWIQLGIECSSDGDYPAAQHYYTEAVALAATEDPGDRALALRYLAGIHYVTTNPAFNPARGASLYQQALELTIDNKDPFGGRYFTGFTYQQWAYWLATIGSPDWEEKAALAREAYSAMPENSPFRKNSLSRLDNWANQVRGSGEELPPPVTDVR